MEIAVFDPSGNHGHFAHTQSIIFKNDSITWFLHENVTFRLNVLDSVNKEMQTFFSYYPNQNFLFYYIKAIIKLNKGKWDFIFFNTLEANWLSNFIFFIFIKKNSNIILTIHNIHTFFAPVKYNGLKVMIKKWTRQLALKKCRLNVYSNNLKKCLLNYKPEANIFLLPYKVHIPEQNINTRTHNYKFNIVIPGTIDVKRRDYYFVLEVIKKTLHLQNIQYVLLGRPYGEESLPLIKEFQKIGKAIKYYDKFVDEMEFETQMQSSDLIWGPLTKFYKTGDISEEYGISKETGITFAIIRYAKPGIFPKEVSIMEEIKPGIKFYTGLEELVQIITELSTNNTEMVQLKNKMLVAAQKFNVENIKKEFLNQFYNR